MTPDLSYDCNSRREQEKKVKKINWTWRTKTGSPGREPFLLVATSVVLVRSFVVFFCAFAPPVSSPPGGHDFASYCFHFDSDSGIVFRLVPKHFRGIFVLFVPCFSGPFL